MNRNTEIHFSELPTVDIGRSKFDRSHTKWTTIDAGRLYPVYVDTTIMPGDTVKMRTSELIRMMTPVAPVMDDCFADITAWFVPHRLVWPNFKRFMGENDTAPWAQTTEYQVPALISKHSGESEGFEAKSLGDYMGFPVFKDEDLIEDGDDEAPREFKVNALPVRAYNLIWNEFWRDENLQNPVNIDTGDADQAVISYTNGGLGEDEVTYSTYGGLKPLKVCKIPDYFTMCLPAAQKGPAVTLPMNGTAPINYKNETGVSKTWDDKTAVMKGGVIQNRNSSGTGLNSYTDYGAVFNQGYKNEDGTITLQAPGVHNVFDPTDAPEQFSLYADLTQATGATITALRQAFALQKFYERQARGGTRYIEMVKSHFGVTNPDFRLQRPEYLGGHRTLINMNQVVATTSATDQPLGDTGAYSVTQNTNEDLFTHSFTEHGTLMILICIRQRHSYTQGLNRQFFMRNLTDFYFPEFANLSEQPVYKKEIYMEGGDLLENRKSTDDEAFGYQEAWAHYRYFPDGCTGEMRPNYAQSLGKVWTYTDDYDECPTLGDKWIEETKDNIQRTLAIDNHDQFMVNMYFGAIYTRPMPLYSIPGLIDHH